jgi:hypothetical protein
MSEADSTRYSSSAMVKRAVGPRARCRGGRVTLTLAGAIKSVVTHAGTADRLGRQQFVL